MVIDSASSPLSKSISEELLAGNMSTSSNWSLIGAIDAAHLNSEASEPKKVNLVAEDTDLNTLQTENKTSDERNQTAKEDADAANRLLAALEANQRREAENPWVAFENCRIAFAIDTSGSTEGHTLNIEREAVSAMWKLLTPTAQSYARVIPWNDTTESVVQISGLPNLRSYGGTSPTALARTSSSRSTIQNSTFWVLLTDGIINRWEYQAFAQDIATHNLHGIACIIMIFGHTNTTPSNCNISVGVSVFAAVPDCLFLYVDSTSGIMYLMQASGRFTQILEVAGKSQPVLDANTQWFDLPKVNLKDLTHVSIPIPRKLGVNDLALQDGLVINLADLWSGKDLGEETIDAIFAHDDNVRSIMLTSQTRGRVDAFQSWLKRFLEPGAVQFKDGGEAMRKIMAMLEEMQRPETTEQRRIELEQRVTKSEESAGVSRATSMMALSKRRAGPTGLHPTMPIRRAPRASNSRTSSADRYRSSRKASSLAERPVHTAEALSSMSSDVRDEGDDSLEFEGITEDE